jgi:hypothetical protein
MPVATRNQQRRAKRRSKEKTRKSAHVISLADFRAQLLTDEILVAANLGRQLLVRDSSLSRNVLEDLPLEQEPDGCALHKGHHHVVEVIGRPVYRLDGASQRVDESGMVQGRRVGPGSEITGGVRERSCEI